MDVISTFIGYYEGFNPLNQVYRLNRADVFVVPNCSLVSFNPLNQVYRLNAEVIGIK